MISSVGTLPKGIETEKLTQFTPDPEIKKELEYLNIPILNPEDLKNDEFDEDSEEIFAGDTIIFSTINTEEMSYLQFHIYNPNYENIFVHHDTYVFNTISNSAAITINNKAYVALGTFDKNVYVYDPLVRNPMLPQILLRGHEDAVLTIKVTNDTLYTGSDDCKIIEWDLNMLSPKKTTTCAGSIGAIELYNNDIIYTSESSLFLKSNIIHHNGIIESIKIVDNTLITSDDTGILRSYDMRNTSTPLKERKAHEESISSFDISDKLIYTASADMSGKILDFETFEEASTKKYEEGLYSVKIYEDIVIYGGETQLFFEKKDNSNSDKKE